MRSEARLYTRRNDDPDWTALPIGAQWAFDLVLSQEDLEHHGVIALRPARWAHQAHGITEQDLAGYLQVLHERRFVVIDDTYGELFLRSLLRQDKVYKQPNVLRSAAIRLGHIKSPTIRDALHTELARISELDDLSEPCRLIVKEMLEATAPGAPASSTRPTRRLRSTPKRSNNRADHPATPGSANPSPKGSPNPADNRSAGPSANADAYRPPNPATSGSANPPTAPTAAGDAAKASSERSATPHRMVSANPAANPSRPGSRQPPPNPTTTDPASNSAAATPASIGVPARRQPLGGWDLNDLQAATIALTKPWLATLAIPPGEQLLDDVEYQISTALIAGHRPEHVAAALATWHNGGSTDPRQLNELIETPAADHNGQQHSTAATAPASADEWLAIAEADQ